MCGCTSESTPVTASLAPNTNIVPSTVVNGVRGMRGLRGLGEFQQQSYREDNWLAANSNFRALESGGVAAPAPAEIVSGVSNTALAVGGVGTIAALAAAYFAAKKFKLF